MCVELRTREGVSHHFGGVLTSLTKFREIPVSVNFCPQFWGRKWPRQSYGRLENCILSAGKPQVHKIPRFRGGGVFWFFWGGGKCRFIFMEAESMGELTGTLCLETAHFHVR